MVQNTLEPELISGNSPPDKDGHFRQGSREKSNKSSYFGSTFVISCLLILSFLIANIPLAEAQDNKRILNPGDAVVTGFSGIQPADVEVDPEGSPLDKFFIDLNGASAQIKSIRSLNGPASGQLVDAPAARNIKASEVGQVFAIALDDGLGQSTPNIYLGATSYFGLQIVHPDNNEDGKPDRLKKGEEQAEWMAGQFGPGGNPGSIWRVDGVTGKVTLFTSLPNNSGPGVGDIVFDKATQQFFASDLDTGLVYRISKDGEILDSFDHGVKGRPTKELEEVADDGKTLNIKEASFDSEDTTTWGYTQVERRVNGMAVRDGRLYYAVNHQVWSIGITADGFSDDVRWEFDAKDLQGEGPITDLLFDNQGRIYLAQRGKAKASYDYSAFTESGQSTVARYRRESPDNPDTESVWVSDREEYAIGKPADHYQADGGIALGYGYDENGNQRANSCNAMIWSTGSRLRPGQFAGVETVSDDGGETEKENDVHGLQGNEISLVRPQNTPPEKSYFVDYDNMYGDAKKSGHLGDVEIWQPCEGATFTDYFEPEEIVDFPPDWIPPRVPFNANLRLTKWASPKKCKRRPFGWRCRYRIRIRNTGPDTYAGPIQIKDRLVNPQGSTAFFIKPPGWSCWSVGAAKYRCGKPFVVLHPGQSVVITAIVRVPRRFRRCHIRNVAEIRWAPGGTRWNTNPFDDIDDAVAFIPKRNCPSGKKANLRLKKRAFPKFCKRVGIGLRFRCRYRITVRNTGPGVYKGKIRIKDTPAPGTKLVGSAPGAWNCNLNTGVCRHPFTTLLPGQAKHLWVWVRVRRAVAKRYRCRIRNRARIVFAPGGSLRNTDPGDDADVAYARIPRYVCRRFARTNLKLTKTRTRRTCVRFAGKFHCRYRIRVRNTGPGNYVGKLVVRDRFPLGTTASFGASPQWNCVSTGPSRKRCTHPLTIMGPGQYRDLIVRVRVPIRTARRLRCRVRNRAKILFAPGGSIRNFNPADDQDSALMFIPRRYCRKSNLQIRKYPVQRECQRLGGKFYCRFRVDVKNTGPSPYFGKISVQDIPQITSNVSTVPGSWNCIGTTCNHPPTFLAVGAKKSFFITLRVTRQHAREKNCKVRNKARITFPLGAPRNTLAGDDESTATANIPDYVCKRPPPPECPPGFTWNPITKECEPVVIIPPGGNKCPRGMRPVSRRTAAILERRGWVVRRVGRRLWCARPGQTVDRCPRGMRIISPTQARILQRRGWTIRQVGRLWCGRPGQTVDRCPRGMRIISPTQARILQRRGWTIRQVGRLWCGRPGQSVDRCPRGMRIISPSQVRVLQRRGWTVRRVGRLWCGRPGNTVRRCPPGMRVISPSQARVLQRRGWTVTRVGRLWCGRPGRTVRPRRCPPGTIGRWPNCRRIERPCPPGTVGRWPRCRRIQRPVRPIRPFIRNRNRGNQVR